jgi:hypothetical protein
MLNLPQNHEVYQPVFPAGNTLNARRRARKNLAFGLPANGDNLFQ